MPRRRSLLREMRQSRGLRRLPVVPELERAPGARRLSGRPLPPVRRAPGRPNGGGESAVITIGGGHASAEPAAEAEEDDGLKPLSDRLVTELTAHRMLALRDALANDPATAFAAALHCAVPRRLLPGAVRHLPGDLGQERELQRPGARARRQRLGKSDRGPPSAMGEAVAQGRG
jgi:hypothetical protein